MNKKETFKLPKYLRLEKGSMWLDNEGDDCSGISLYAFNKVLLSRPFRSTTITNKDGQPELMPEPTDVPRDENDNKDTLNYGAKKGELPWYIDTSKIDKGKLSRILLAYKFGILVKADPKKPPAVKELNIKADFSFKDNGDRIFVGKNKEMYTKLQNYTFDMLRKFVNEAPLSVAARNNIIDLYDYEIKGRNPFSRPRQEVLDLLKDKLKEYGPGMTTIRKNE